MSDGKDTKFLVKSIANPPEGTLECHFIKVTQDEIAIDTIAQQLLVSTIRNNSVVSLYSLVSIY